jgi:ribosomal protein S6--L-glutamate ligase
VRFCILGSSENWFVRDLQRASADHSVEVCAFDSLQAKFVPSMMRGDALTRWEVWGGQVPIHEMDALFVRTMPLGTLEQVVVRIDTLHMLQQEGVEIVNPPRTLEIAIDKWLTLYSLRNLGVRLPPTICCQQRSQAMEAFEQLGGDVVVKPIFGGEGRGIMRVTDPDIAWRVFSTLDQLRHVAYLQKYLPHFGYDLRLLAIGRKVIAVRRESHGDWRTNISRGATAVAVEATDMQVELVHRIMDRMQATVLGIDLLPAEDGSEYLLEVNAVPGWRGTAEATGVDVASEIVRETVRRIEQRKAKG